MKCPEIDLSITQEDIAMGERYNAHNCAAALALKRHFVPDANLSICAGSFLVFTNEERLFSCANPPELKDWIQRFDAGQHVEPATFHLVSNPVGRYDLMDDSDK